MSSMRNAVQRRSHRERAQPLERKRLGLLEKHKDYKLRAQDHNRKKAQLKALRQKAADRNEDEFYFGMLSREGPGHRLNQGKKWRGTVDGDRGNKAMSVDTVRLLKTQDIGYVRTMRSVIGKQVDRLREQIILASDGMEDEEDEDADDFDDFDDMRIGGGAPARPKKIVFMDEESVPANGSPAESFDDEYDNVDEDDEDFEGLDGEEEEGEEEEDVEAARERRRKERNLKRLRAELQAAETKLKALTDAERELEIQQAKMAKTATSGGSTKKGQKIKVRARKK